MTKDDLTHITTADLLSWGLCCVCTTFIFVCVFSPFFFYFIAGFSNAAFMSNFVRNSHQWQIDTLPSEFGHSSPHLRNKPTTSVSQNPCENFYAHACPFSGEWKNAIVQKEIQSMKFVFYNMMKANESIVIEELNAIPSTKDTFDACMKSGRTKIVCVDEVVSSYPLHYCRHIKNGPGMYRSHKGQMIKRLMNLQYFVNMNQNQEYINLLKDMSIEDLCDPWRSVGATEQSVVDIVSNEQMFMMNANSKTIRPPSYSLIYTEDPWNEKVADVFWSFQIAHELAHELIQTIDTAGEMLCDTKAMELVDLAFSDVEAKKYGIISIAQLMCVNGENKRVRKLGDHPAVKTLFECN